MTPEQKIKKEIVLKAIKHNDIKFGKEIDESNVQTAYQMLIDEDLHLDYRNEMRVGSFKTEVESDYSRHYESKSVAMKMADGSWLGWTYWYGGGKFGEPEAIDWMNQAYELNCEEKEKVVIVRTFEKI